jgi:hypothetical protein
MQAAQSEHYSDATLDRDRLGGSLDWKKSGVCQFPSRDSQAQKLKILPPKKKKKKKKKIEIII